jgi:hypothetical protein
MKAYKIEILVIDFDEVGELNTVEFIKDARYPNHCISPIVMSTKAADIGDWHDDHPLNKKDTMELEYRKIFT